jgi:diguanylate cyclase (GGDEF)-like protein
MALPLTAAQILQLIVPGISAIFSLCFLCVWIYDRQRFYLIALAASFCAYTLGSASQILHLPQAWRPNALVSATFYAGSILLLSEGILRRLRRPFHWATHVFVLAAILAGIAYFSTVTVDLLARIYVLNFGFGAVLIATAWRSRPRRRARIDDHAVFWVLLVFGVSFFARTALTASNSLPRDAARFGQSAFWLALQLSLALLGAVLAMLLLAAAIADIIEHLIAERDRDALTQTLNRRAFERHAARLMDDPKGYPLTIVACDLDHFKSINDRFGHAAGDAVLREFGQIVMKTIRTDDIVARMGGEEFVILLGKMDLSGACAVAERVRLALIDAQFDGVAASLRVTMSAGVAVYQEGDSLAVWLARADSLLYAAKRSGRNRTVSHLQIESDAASIGGLT